MGEVVGQARLRNRYLNKGTAFTTSEREAFGLDGLLPPVVEDLNTQLDRTAVEFAARDTDLERHVFMRALEERNVVLFQAFLQRHLEALLPIVYTPTVGAACQQWSRIYRQEHGLFLSWPDRHRATELLDNAIADRDIDVVVVTDGERILGLGDLGIGGMGIPIGKLALYTAVGGIDPARTLPVVLDAGTDNDALLSDPLYLGWRHHRVRDARYDELVDSFVDALHHRLPRVLLQWEDFAQVNAGRLLERHRERLCSFNDDIQGTAAVTVAAIIAGLVHADVPLHELRLVIAGAGSAGVGVANQAVRALEDVGLTSMEARSRCWLVDRNGLLHDRMNDLPGFQHRYVRAWSDVESWDDNSDGEINLLEVVRHVEPHALVGVTGQPGLFTEQVVTAMAAGTATPIVLPLSNPTPRSEAVPADVLRWTEGRAIIGTGSPFDPVRGQDRTHEIAQVNNVYIFPGVGLGCVVAEAQQVTDAMMTAATNALAAVAVQHPGRRLLPPVTDARRVAEHVALTVAQAAIDDRVAPERTAAELRLRLASISWEPHYAASTTTGLTVDAGLSEPTDGPK